MTAVSDQIHLKPEQLQNLWMPFTANRQFKSAPRLLAQGVDIVASPPPQFAVFLRNEVAKWAKVVKDAKVQAN